MTNEDFDSLIQQHYPRVRRAALLLTGESWDADDLAQETFLQAMQSWSRFDPQHRVESWLLAILLNLDRKRKRRYVRAWRRLNHWIQKQPDRVVHEPSEAIEIEEWRQSIWSAVAELPEMQRHTILLRYAEGMQHAEISQVLACPEGTVKSRLHHGLNTLKQRLGTARFAEYEVTQLQPSCCGEQT